MNNRVFAPERCQGPEGQATRLVYVAPKAAVRSR